MRAAESAAPTTLPPAPPTHTQKKNEKKTSRLCREMRSVFFRNNRMRRKREKMECEGGAPSLSHTRHTWEQAFFLSLPLCRLTPVPTRTILTRPITDAQKQNARKGEHTKMSLFCCRWRGCLCCVTRRTHPYAYAPPSAPRLACAYRCIVAGIGECRGRIGGGGGGKIHRGTAGVRDICGMRGKCTDNQTRKQSIKKQ